MCELWCYNILLLLISRYPSETPLGLSNNFTEKQDLALVRHVDATCRHLSVTADSLQVWDIHLSEAQIASDSLSPLQGKREMSPFPFH